MSIFYLSANCLRTASIYRSKNTARHCVYFTRVKIKTTKHQSLLRLRIQYNTHLMSTYYPLRYNEEKKTSTNFDCQTFAVHRLSPFPSPAMQHCKQHKIKNYKY